MSLRRAVLLFVTIVLAYVVQTSVVAALPWPLAGPDLYLLVVLAWLMLLPKPDAYVVAFLAGLLLDLAPPSNDVIGKWAMVLLVATWVMSRLGTGGDTPIFRVGLLAGGSALSMAAAYLGSGILGERAAAPESLLLNILGIGIWNLVFAPWILMLARRLVRSTAVIEVVR